MPGNKWEWQNWWNYVTSTGVKRVAEPAPKHIIIPVETKEEAVTQAMVLGMRPCDIREKRQTQFDVYISLYQKFFSEYPDDFHLYPRMEWELPVRYRVALLKELREKYGWEVDRLKVKKRVHPDGRLLSIGEFNSEWGVTTDAYTKLPRMVARAAKEALKTKKEEEAK